MGKLIKNHLARLIILTAATCTHSPSHRHHDKMLTSLEPNRSNCGWYSRILLAQNFLGYVDKGTEPSGHPAPNSSNLQHYSRSVRIVLGIPSAISDPKYCSTPVDCSPPLYLPHLSCACSTHLSRDQSGNILHCWSHCLLLGI